MPSAIILSALSGYLLSERELSGMGINWNAQKYSCVITESVQTIVCISSQGSLAK